MVLPFPPVLSDIADALTKRSAPFLAMEARVPGTGALIATADCARVLAFARDMDSPSVFWCDPRLLDQAGPGTPMGGPVGGERLWFGPEARYHWQGPPDWTRFTNYKPSTSADPGAYTMAAVADGSIGFDTKISLLDHQTGDRVVAAVTKRVRLLDADELAGGTCGLEVSAGLLVEPGDHSSPVDLWAIVQLPPGTALRVPLKPDARSAVSYAATPGCWTQSRSALEWQFTGTEQAKLGLAAPSLHGLAHTQVPTRDGERTGMTIHFLHAADRPYCDHPYGQPLDDQVFQAWDGLGFGEIEVHSPAAFTSGGPAATELSYKIILSTGE